MAWYEYFWNRAITKVMKIAIVLINELQS